MKVLVGRADFHVPLRTSLLGLYRSLMPRISRNVLWTLSCQKARQDWRTLEFSPPRLVVPPGPGINLLPLVRLLALISGCTMPFVQVDEGLAIEYLRFYRSGGYDLGTVAGGITGEKSS